MKIKVIGLLIIFCITIPWNNFSQFNTRPPSDKIKINLKNVQSIKIKNNFIDQSNKERVIKQLNPTQIKQFTGRWNLSKSHGPAKLDAKYWFVVSFKDGSKRTFLATGNIIKENKDWGFDIGDYKFFDNLWNKAIDIPLE